MLRPTLTKKRMLQILTRSSGNDRASRVCDWFLSTLILLNLAAVAMESVSSIGTKYGTAFFIFEMFSVTIFGIEYVSRIWCMAANEASIHSSPFRRRIEYIFSFTGLIDPVSYTHLTLPTKA